MSGFIETAQAELRAIFGDRAVLLVMIGGSIFYALFYPLPYRAQVATALPVAVLDRDGVNRASWIGRRGSWQGGFRLARRGHAEDTSVAGTTDTVYRWTGARWRP